ncbi:MULTISPECIES: ABC transporter ATP-binding protein [Stutzerimonas]|jgi:NitT/TauT family transport system ATP-binding protein|uniref:NitT/TauT family transport system ATP-binding protein n=1 Tax=Stutzerimonas stutzeri TaxID=316 RepID=A0A5S5BGU2_STUST|nr:MULTISPECIES: ABC transporter ATP-binding protein [Stutzerimonas]MBU0812907.1 ABC transporter ATP-binding protein [Gammaproteobacteria bacterium]MBK3847305.1 ATP-binding cassette domain-containing protein [Stutzerimonas xanthomarina]MBU1302586.1 ABC transporter ATP-binding protein [Gammaproteobacteria bacterium]MBU1458623.1 ABC transporter ATP-binding protein [Gammaproteobacteria bacterium]MBU1774415.1 ABC transporter ATP-binding protein [Gammaproteobacteria bacterium]
MNQTETRSAVRPSITFEQVRQVFTSSDGSEVVALDDTSFAIDRHEFIAVIGPSGCGKSTLLRILAGLIQPTSGHVSIYGKKLDGPRDEVGIVFQKPTLLPWLTIRDNLTFPMKHKYGRVTQQERERGEELLQLVGLQEFGGKRPDELSGGMQQRAGIARALLHDPEILLMDEPFSALDALTRDELSLELLNIWTQRPKTVLFITHSIPEALLLADRILVMSARPGRVTEIIDVDIPRPRSLDTLTEPRFNELANHIRRKVFSRHGL